MKSIPFFAISVVAMVTLASAQLPRRYQQNGATSQDRFGHAVSLQGDWNNDGIKDIVVGAPGQTVSGSGPGYARVLSGSTGATLATVNGTTPSGEFGAAVAGPVDLNGDGYGDLVVSAPKAAGPPGLPGTVTVFSGATGLPLLNLVGTVDGEEFGRALAVIGDTNGNGSPEIVVGSPLWQTPGLVWPGRVRVFDGSTGALLHTLSGTTNSQNFGQSVTGIGDRSGDGVEDFAVGAPGSAGGGVGRGAVFLYSGASGAPLTSPATLVGNRNGAAFGFQVAAGDVSADGTRDLIVTAPGGLTGPGIPRGAVHSGASGAFLFWLPNWFSLRVAFAGDTNRDGFGDVVVADPFEIDAFTGESGVVSVRSGATGNELAAWTNDSGCYCDYFGVGIAGGVDLQNDGFPDLVAGANSLSGSGPFGRVQVISVAGTAAYGVDIEPAQTLDLGWSPGPSGHAGLLVGGGAAPSAAGFLAVSTASATLSAGGFFTILADITLPSSFLLPIAFDGAGQLLLPVDLLNPAIAGAVFYAQLAELSGTAPAGLYVSNGLAVLFSG